MAGILENIMQGYANKVLGGSGASPTQAASAYQRLQQAIAQDYDYQKQQFEQNPANKGKQWQMPKAAERFRDQVDAMIMSGDPILQKRGMALLEAPKDERSAFQKDFEFLQEENPSMTRMSAYQMVHPGRAVTNVNVSMGEKPMSIDDLMKLRLPNGQLPPVGMTLNQAGQAGATPVQSNQQTDRGIATDAAVAATNDLGKNLDANVTPLQGLLGEVRNSGGLLGGATNAILSTAGIPNDPAVVEFTNAQKRLAGQVTKLMSGASATDQERAYWQSIQPSLVDSPEIRRMKYKQAIEFRDMLAARAASAGVQGYQGGNPKAPEPAATPKATKRYNPTTGKIEVIQ